MSRHIQQIIKEVLKNNQTYSQGDDSVREDMKKLFKSDKKGKIEGFARKDNNDD